MSQRTHKITTRRTMRKLHKGDKFYINGVEMTAGEDAHLIANDASDEDEYIIYDVDENGWFEEDFPEIEGTIQEIKIIKNDIESPESIEILDKAIEVLKNMLARAE